MPWGLGVMRWGLGFQLRQSTQGLKQEKRRQINTVASTTGYRTVPTVSFHCTVISLNVCKTSRVATVLWQKGKHEAQEFNMSTVGMRLQLLSLQRVGLIAHHWMQMANVRAAMCKDTLNRGNSSCQFSAEQEGKHVYIPTIITILFIQFLKTDGTPLWFYVSSSFFLFCHLNRVVQEEPPLRKCSTQIVCRHFHN